TRMSEAWLIKRLSSRQMVVVGHQKYKSLASGFPKGLNAAPFIGFSPESPMRLTIDKFFIKNKIRPSYIAEVDDFTLSQFFLEQGLGVGLISRTAANESLKKRALVEIGSIDELEPEL